VIPSGTTLTIRTNETIDADKAGQTFSAQVAQNIVDETNQVLVPAGSPAELVVAQVSTGGTVGTPTMQLAIRSVTVNGRKYDISTFGLEERGEEGLGTNRRTAETVGGGALLGTLIGAIAGGGKGAAIGAATGAAAGAAAQVITRGDEIKVPAETVLTFRLDQQLRLEGYA
jgi:hypothetical protein